jgi:hypothetical protein
LTDKLTIANVRLWHLEDRRRDRSLPDSERLKAADMVSTVNAERNALIEEIDALFNDSLERGQAPLVKKSKLYGP